MQKRKNQTQKSSTCCGLRSFRVAGESNHQVLRREGQHRAVAQTSVVIRTQSSEEARRTTSDFVLQRRYLK